LAAKKQTTKFFFFILLPGHALVGRRLVVELRYLIHISHQLSFTYVR